MGLQAFVGVWSGIRERWRQGISLGGSKANQGGRGGEARVQALVCFEGISAGFWAWTQN